MIAWGRLVRATARHVWVFGLWSVGAFAGAPHLVRDINANVIPISSGPTDFFDLGATSFFDADDGVEGYEPWVTDGTAAGTFRWGDLSEGGAGATQREPVQVGGQTFLIDNNPLSGDMPEIWVAGATPQSVRHFSTPELATRIGAGNVGALGNAFIFSVFNSAINGRELWSSDGTQAGTRLIRAANGDPYAFAGEPLVVDSLLYFFSRGAGDLLEPWVTNGTQAGTRRLAAIPNVGQNNNGNPRLARLGDFALFAIETTDSGVELWRIDLRNDTVVRVADLAPGPASSLRQGEPLRSLNGAVIFNASAAGDDDRTTWRSDGTAAGTLQIAAVAMLDDPDAVYLGSSDMSRLFFRVLVGTSDVDTWTTDGSAANTTLFRNSQLANLQRIGQRYYFTSGVPEALWTTDGTAAGTRMLNVIAGGARLRELTGDDNVIYVRSVNPGTGLDGGIHRHVLASGATSLVTTYSFTNFGLPRSVFGFAQGRLYFDNEDAVNGRELWISDGTPAGTRLLMNVAPEQQTQDSAPADFVRFNDRLYFTADDGSHGRELWRSDGTEAGTTLFFDARPGPTGSEPTTLFVAANRLFFFARDAAAAYRLWSWDGTASAPQPLVASRPITPPNATTCDSTGVPVNGAVLFRAFDASGALPFRLWTSDGTSAGTRIVADIGLGAGGSCEHIAVGDRYYFQTGAVNGSVWSFDGASIALVADSQIGAMARNLIAHNGRLYFIANDVPNSQRLWTSDGTTVGTRVVDLFGAGSPLAAFGPLQAGLFTYVRENENGSFISRVWMTDGTTATRLSSDIQLMPSPVFGIGPAFVNRGKAYFFAAGGSTGPGPLPSGPAVTDGTPAGTRLLATLLPTATVHSFADFGGITFFQTSHPFAEPQVWRTDGTTAGTRQVADFHLGTHRLAANQNLFYVSAGVGTGVELFAIDNTRPVAVNDSLGSVQAGNSASASVVANDTDADGALDPASVTVVTQPASGSVTVAANGTVTYSARSGFSGADSFSYSVSDDQAYASSPATVQLTVTAAPPSPPPPSSGGGGGGGGGALREVELLALLLMLLFSMSSFPHALRLHRWSQFGNYAHETLGHLHLRRTELRRLLRDFPLRDRFRRQPVGAQIHRFAA